jgi:hypothetical protein
MWRLRGLERGSAGAVGQVCIEHVIYATGNLDETAAGIEQEGEFGNSTLSLTKKPPH